MSGATRLWVRGQLRGRWAGLVALALFVTLVGGVTLGVATAAQRAHTSVDRFASVTRVQNVDVDLDFSFFEHFSQEARAALPSSEEMVDRIRQVAGVEGVTGVSFIEVAPEIDGRPPGPEAEFFSGAVGATWGESLRFHVIEGRAADPANPHEVLVNEASPDAWGVGVGDTLTLHTLAPDQLDVSLGLVVEEPQGPQIDVEVVGVFRDIEDITDFPEPILLATPAFVEGYQGEVGITTGAALVRADPDRLDQVIADLQAAVPPEFVVSESEDFIDRVRDVLSVEVTALRIFAATAAVVGLAVVFQVLVRHLGAAASGLQVARALGMRRRQMVVSSVVAVVPALVAGLLGAVAVAVAISWFLPRGVARRADPDQGIYVDIPTLVIGTILLIVVLLGLAVLAATLVTRRTIRSASARTLRPGRLRVRGPLGLPLPPALGARYALGGGRTLGRAGWAGLVGAAVAVTGIVAVASVTASADQLLSSPEMWGASWDAGAIVEAGHDEELARLLDAEPEVEAAALGLAPMNPGALSTVGPDGLVILEPFAFQPIKGEMGPVVTAGRAPAGRDEAVLGADLAEQVGIDVGDSFQIDTPRGSEQMTMVGELVFPGVDHLGGHMVLTPDGINALLAGCPPDAEDLSCSMPFVDLGIRYRPGADRAEVSERLAESGLSLEEPDPPSEVNNLEQIGATPWLLAGFLAVLGLAGLAHALIVGTWRQRHDMAVTRVLGLRPGQAAAVVRWQAVILAGLGTVAGLFVGAVVGRLLWRRIATSIGAIVSVDLSPWVLVLVPATVVAALLIGLPAAYRAARRRPVDALRAE